MLEKGFYYLNLRNFHYANSLLFMLISCRHIIFLLIICTNILHVFANENMVVRGFVLNEQQQPIEMVDVSVQQSPTRTVTDKFGKFEIHVSAQDSFFLVFSSIAHRPAIRKVYVNEKYVTNVTVVLQDVINELTDIEVKGEKHQHTTAEWVNTEFIKVLPSASGKSIESLIKSFSGVSSTNELSSQYSVRGGSYDENSVYVNGIEIYRPFLIRSGEQEGLSFINTDMVGEVTFSAGGFDARYGDKLSSVLDITYKQPSTFEGNVAVSFAGASAYIGSATNKWTQMHGLRYKNASYLLGTLQTKAEYNPNFIDYQSFVTYKPSTNWSFSLLGNVSQNVYNFVPESRETTFGTLENLQKFTIYFDGQEKDIFRTGFGAFSTTYQPNKKVGLTFIASAFATNEQENYDIKGEYWLNKVSSASSSSEEVMGVGTYFEHARNEMNVFVCKATHHGTFDINRSHAIVWGVDAVSEKVIDAVNEWEMRDSAGYSLPYSPTEIRLYESLSSAHTFYSTRLRSYLQYSYKNISHHGLFVLTSGLRCNYWDWNNEMTISPRITASYFPDWQQRINFRFATGVYYQTPSFKEIKDTITKNGNLTHFLNKNIQSQRSLQFIAGTDYFFNWWYRPFKFTTEVYYKNMTNVISYTIDNVKVTYSGKNDAKAYATGIDMKLFGEFVPGVDSWLSVSIMNTKEDIDDDGYGYLARPMGQLYNFSIFFQDYVPKFPAYRVHLLFNWSQGFPVTSARGERFYSNARMPDYRRVDIGASRIFDKKEDTWMLKPAFKHIERMHIGIEVLNLFGFYNVNSYYWVTDVFNQQNAVPNYLTGTQLNVKLQVDF